MAATLQNAEPDTGMRPALPEGTESLKNEQHHPSEFTKAERRFREELPRLLEKEKLGTWVLFSAEGLVDMAENPRVLDKGYGALIGSKYFLACVVEEMTEAEVTSNWYPPR
jgi:hypothetical protein